MKSRLILIGLITLSGLSAFGRSTTLSSQLDSLPAPQRYHFKLASDTGPKQQPWTTVFFYPAKSPAGNEISLPLGFDPTTLRLSSGDRVLAVDEDYVLIPNANRIRVLDEEALTAQQPIRISYQGIRLNLGYKP